MNTKTSDPYAPYYKQFEHESAQDKEMYATIGRIVVAWGAAESVLAKLWWHKAFLSGVELSSNKVYRAPISEKLKSIRKLTPRDENRADLQLRQLERGFPELDADRHALVHGYLGITSKGPASINLRTDHTTFAGDLKPLLAWSVYLADVAHQSFGEATCAIYRGVDRIYLPDPEVPPRYVRANVAGVGKLTTAST